MLKRIKIDEELHRQAKAQAALQGISLREFTETALTAALPDRARVLVDSSPAYSIDPRYDCNPNETDEEDSDE